MTPEIAVILNPAAGGGKALKTLPAVQKALERHGQPHAIHVTKERGGAVTAARDFANGGARMVIAVGGDGTLHEVANGLHTAERQAALGIVAVGHGRDFARTIGTPKQVDAAIERALSATPRPLDLGLVTYADGSDCVFINIAGLGFDALVAEGSQDSRLPGSNLPYLATALKVLARFENIPTTVESEDGSFTDKAVFVQIANAQYMGGGFHFAPMADLADGLLDVCIVGDFSKGELIRQIPGVYRGRHVTHPKFRHFRTRSVTISTDPPANLQLDGELLGATPVTFSVLPGRLMLAG